MRRAIKALQIRIGNLNDRHKQSMAIADEPELLSDYHFAMNDLANIELEIIELQSAIKILNGVKKPKRS